MIDTCLYNSVSDVTLSSSNDKASLESAIVCNKEESLHNISSLIETPRPIVSCMSPPSIGNYDTYIIKKTLQ